MEYIRKTNTISILPADVRASNVSSADFNIVSWHGLAKFYLDVEAQGSGKEVTVKLQDSNDVASGVKYREDTSLGDTILRADTDVNIKLGARFKQVGAKQVKRISLPLKRAGTITEGKIVKVSLYTEESDAPDTLVATSAEVLCSSIGTEYANITFEFDVPVALANTTDYFIVLEGTYDTSGTNCIKWQTDTVSSGGNYIDYTSSWQAGTATKSLLFTNWEYDFKDITGGTFAKVENKPATESIVINIDNIKPYLRAITTGANTNTGATCLIMVGVKKYPKRRNPK